MMHSFKKKILEKILDNLKAEMNVMLKAAAEAREAATHEESIAEDKYDTRGLEASYLAGAQAKRASELERLIEGIQSLEIMPLKNPPIVALTTLVEVLINSQKSLFFIVPKGGGLSLQIDDQHIQVITPDSRLGSELLGKSVADQFELKIGNNINEYEILKIS